MLDYEFHPRAKSEFLDAVRYYDGVLDGLGDRFAEEIVRGIGPIRRQPEIFTVLGGRTRRCLTQTFPYGILFSVSGGKVRILAAMHFHRHPDYWMDRVKDLPE